MDVHDDRGAAFDPEWVQVGGSVVDVEHACVGWRAWRTRSCARRIFATVGGISPVSTRFSVPTSRWTQGLRAPVSAAKTASGETIVVLPIRSTKITAFAVTGGHRSPLTRYTSVVIDPSARNSTPLPSTYATA
jgi:hypothetical protein